MRCCELLGLCMPQLDMGDLPPASPLLLDSPPRILPSCSWTEEPPKGRPPRTCFSGRWYSSVADELRYSRGGGATGAMRTLMAGQPLSALPKSRGLPSSGGAVWRAASSTDMRAREAKSSELSAEAAPRAGRLLDSCELLSGLPEEAALSRGIELDVRAVSVVCGFSAVGKSGRWSGAAMHW